MRSLSRTRAVNPSESIVERVANAERREPTELDPLYETVDCEALDALVRNARRHGATFRIEFEYHGHTVTVTDDGPVRIDGEAWTLEEPA